MAIKLDDRPDADNPIDERYHDKLNNQDKIDDEFNKQPSPENMARDGKSRGESVDLGSAEDSAVRKKGGVVSGGSPSLEDKNPPRENQRSAFTILRNLSGKKKGVVGGVGGITVLIILILFPIIAGPLQLIHISKLLLSNFDMSNEMGDIRTGRLIRHLWHADAPERARLGVIADRVATKVENKLRSDGIEVLKTDDGHRMRGFKIKGQEFPVDGKNHAQRKAFRAALRDSGYGRIATALMSRPMFARYGVDLRPLGNLRGQAGESTDAFKKRIRANNDARISDGVHNVSIRSIDGQIKELNESRDENTENNKKIDEKIKKLENTRAEMDRAGKGSLGEAGEIQQEVREAIRNTDGTESDKIKAGGEALIKNIGKGSAIVAAVGMSVCLARAIAKAAPLAEVRNKFIPMIRIAMTNISIGEQLLGDTSGDITEEEISVALENLSNEFGDWSDAEHMNLLKTGSFVGVSSPGLAIGAAAESGWVEVGEALNMPGVDGLCSLMGNVVFQAGAAGAEFLFNATGVGALVRIAVIEVSFEAFARFIVSPHGASVIASIGGIEVTGSTAGPNRGNAMPIGSFYAANLVAAEMGGVTLTNEEATLTQAHIEESNPERFDERSLFDRYANINLPSSLLGSFVMRTHLATAGGVLNFNPVNLVSSFFSAIPSFFTNSVTASNSEPFSGVGKVGFTVEEMTSEVTDNPFENEIYLLGRFKENPGLKNELGECIPEPLNLNEPRSGYYTVERLCADRDESFQNDLLRYRMYLLDQKLLLGLGCYAGDNISCAELGLRGGGSAPPPATAGQIVSGTVRELAQQILDNEASGGGISFQMDGGIYDQKDLTFIPLSRGEQAIVNDPDIPPTTTNVSAELLRIILQANADGHNFQILSVTTRDHSDTGAHPNGMAVDFAANDELYKYFYNNSTHNGGDLCVGGLIYMGEVPRHTTGELNLFEGRPGNKNASGHTGHIHLSVTTNDIRGCH